MEFDPTNHIVKLCADGMLLEGEGKNAEALMRYQQAWAESSNAYEQLISAHYVARQQESVPEKLKWDLAALQAALQVRDLDVTETLPSLYLNAGKCYEDLGDFDSAGEHYQAALSHLHFLPADG